MKVYEAFKKIFPDYASNIAKWTIKDSHSIIVTLKDRSTYIFFYKDDNSWTFGTYRKNKEK